MDVKVGSVLVSSKEQPKTSPELANSNSRNRNWGPDMTMEQEEQFSCPSPVFR